MVGGGGGPGEIEVRGANLFSGYWPDGADGPDPDGWWATADVAYADDDGDLHLVDRRTELILVSGFNVYPAEVEAVLAAHPAVEEAAVLGRPDPERGDETVLAYVVAAPGTAPTERELLDWAARSLARFKLPATIEFVAELPHSATGKVSKARLRESGRPGWYS
jgi:long-chain acyl-CoA synthetase